jgi:hypothetical protein
LAPGWRALGWTQPNPGRRRRGPRPARLLGGMRPAVPHGEADVIAWSFSLWDTADQCVRGGPVFSARCPSCRAPLASRPDAAAWTDADPLAVRWRRDGHFYRIGDPDA